MIVTTTENIPGKKITRVVGLVKGNSIRARHIGRDILAGLRGIVGGEITDYTKAIAETREQAQDRMIESARAQGANVDAECFRNTGIRHGRGGERLVEKRLRGGPGNWRIALLIFFFSAPSASLIRNRDPVYPLSPGSIIQFPITRARALKPTALTTFI